MKRKSRRAFWIGATVALATLHVAMVLPDPFPAIVVWVPATVCRFVVRDVLRDPGTHGFGYLQPRLLLTCAYIFAIALSGAVGGIVEFVWSRRRLRDGH